ncbi:MAG: carboxypeptidase-like regulatory domain-containing protein [Actinomycetota bacterium]|nr:carboxypeptidase-like regulatory domain-containing protein [Actinomycetota bacterium]
MRASLSQTELAASPGQPFVVGVEVANTKEVIDAVAVEVSGVPGARVKTTPSELALFPSTSGSQSVAVELPKCFPAGRHQVALEVRSLVDPRDRVVRELAIEVATVADASLLVHPLRRRGHRKARFTVICRNEGNVDVEIALHATDPERALRLTCQPSRLVVEAGGGGEAALHVRAPRQIFGSERARTINLSGRVAAPGTAGPQAPTLEAHATYVQHPRVPRGVATAAILAAIVALWAAIFSLGLRAVLAEQPLAKSAPLSFFAPVSPGKAAHNAGAATPAGFAPKDFAPLGAAGSIRGRVTSPGQPGGVGRVVVKAVELGPGGGPPTSAATQSDGTYLIAGLFPGKYKISFSAPGFQTVWYGGASTGRGTRAVEVGAGSTINRVNAAIRGLPASIVGHVMTGEPHSPPVRVTLVESPAGPARQPGSGQVDNQGQAQATSTAQASTGTFRFSHLASPAAYTLTFRAHGFLPARERVYVGGGQALAANTVQLQAKPGQIAGQVTGGGRRLGGVEVTASANGETFAAATPTAGAVGRFSLPDLPTPAAYLLRFSKPGYGTETMAVDLGPGQVVGKLRVAMVGGAGTVSGRVVGPKGHPLGGVTVSIGGLATPIVSETLTEGRVGTYTVQGLPTPGTYALTFSRPGYQSETLGVTLRSEAQARGVDVTLPAVIGAISGRVTNAKTGAGLAGAVVVFTDGSQTNQAATTSFGRYTLAQLAPGAYSVTFSYPGYASETALVRLRPGQHVTEDIALEPSR